MTDNVTSWINETQREIGGSRRLADGEGRSVVLRRNYDAPIEDVFGRPAPIPSGWSAGSCRSRAISGPAGPTSSRATRVGRSYAAKSRGCWR